MLASYGTVRAPVPVLRVDQGGPGGPVQIPSLDLQLQPPTQTNKQTNRPGGTFKVAKCVLQRECICDTLRSADFPWRGWRPRHCLLMCSACMLACLRACLRACGRSLASPELCCKPVGHWQARRASISSDTQLFVRQKMRVMFMVYT